MTTTINQTANNLLHGSIVAIATPMFENGQVDWAALKNLVEWHIAEGTHAIVAVGTTGESATLSVEEHAKVIEEVVNTAAKRIPIIAGTGANSTSEAIELTETARKLGADAALLVTPYYNKPTQEGLYLHYRAIAEAVNLPQILYNVPGRTGVDMHNDIIVRLADVAGIAGVKDATGNLERGLELITRLKGRMPVFSGDDATAIELIRLGAKGNISVTANVAPKIMAQMCDAALAGNIEKAVALNAQVATLHQVLFCESNPIPVKWALAEMGLMQHGTRLPLTILAPQYHTIVRNALQVAGLLV